MFNSKKVKSYSFDKFGLAQAKHDIAMKKKDKINKASGIAITLIFLGLGLMSKEFIILYLVNMGIGLTTDWIIK